jgi:hypothetical protein
MSKTTKDYAVGQVVRIVDHPDKSPNEKIGIIHEISENYVIVDVHGVTNFIYCEPNEIELIGVPPPPTTSYDMDQEAEDVKNRMAQMLDELEEEAPTTTTGKMARVRALSDLLIDELL